MITATTPKGERRRQALVVAAAQLLVEGGFEAVRHRSVANRAALPLASTTYYFSSLDELIAAAVEHNGRAELRGMRQRIGGLARRPRNAESAVDSILDVVIGDDTTGGYSLSRCERTLASARHPRLREVQTRLRADFDAVLAEVLRRCGRTADPEHLRQLIAVLDGAILNALGEAEPCLRTLARAALVDVFDLLAPASRGGDPAKQ